jgi:hypothetical protein
MTDETWADFEREARNAIVAHVPMGWQLVTIDIRRHKDVRITASFRWGDDPDRLITLDVNVNEQGDNAAEAVALITGMLDGYKP